MGLDDDGIAGGKAGQHAGPCVPCRERGTGKTHRDPARDNAIGLAKGDLILAETALPQGLRGCKAHGGFGMDQRLDPAVERIHARSRIGHVRALPGGMHDGGHKGEQMLAVKPVEELHQKTDPGFDLGLGPRGHGRLRGGKQRVRVSLRIGDAQRGLGVGRYFLACPIGYAGYVKCEGLALQGLESGQSARLGGFKLGVFPRHFGKRRPAVARRTGGLRAGETVAVAVKHPGASRLGNAAGCLRGQIEPADPLANQPAGPVRTRQNRG